jgi:hypothetical protein
MSCFASCKKIVEEKIKEDNLELKLIKLIEEKFLPIIEAKIKDALKKDNLEVEIDLQDK